MFGYIGKLWSYWETFTAPFILSTHIRLCDWFASKRRPALLHHRSTACRAFLRY